jgi:SAM-dependent methyltransferase
MVRLGSAGTLTELALRCPRCHRRASREQGRIRCADGHEFPIENNTINFLAGGSADLAAAPDHDAERQGMEFRTLHYILPWLSERFGDQSRVRLLDDGAGGGAGVAALVEHGVDAYGVDPGRRTEQWSGSPVQGRLMIADGTDLPFPDETFDAVISSGVLEHVGEAEGRDERDSLRAAYVREMVRVLKRGGVALLAHPNGAHPIDYWHPRRLPLRFHRPYENWMPNVREIRSWLETGPSRVEARFLSPEGYHAFGRTRDHWYGRAFEPPMRALFRLMSRWPVLARTALNPWLVTEIVKPSS